MTDTERYLDHATKGLWGRRRQALRAELTGHITQRMEEFQIAGLSATEAERQTLRELGAPVQVSAGMAQVHGLPTLTRMGLGLALAAALMLSAIQPGLAQVQVFDKDPPGFSIRPPYLSLNSLVEHLRRTGAGAQLSERQLRLKLGGDPATLSLFPGRSTAYGQDAVIRRQDGLYLRSDELVRLLADAGGPVVLSVLRDPAVTVGRVRLNLGTPARPFDARALLEPGVWHDLALKYNLTSHGYWTDAFSTPYRLSGLEPNGVYALATMSGPRFNLPLSVNARPNDSNGIGKWPKPDLLLQPSITLKIEQADAGGHITFPLAAGPVRLGSDPAALRLKHWPDGPAPAVLLKLSTRLDSAAGPLYTVVPAAQVKEVR